MSFVYNHDEIKGGVAGLTYANTDPDEAELCQVCKIYIARSSGSKSIIFAGVCWSNAVTDSIEVLHGPIG